MNCPKCNCENSEGAKFCRMCGSPLVSISTKGELTHNNNSERPQIDSSSIILLVFVITSSVLKIGLNMIDGYYPFIHEMFDPYYFYIGILILLDLTFILPPLAIKNKNIKILGIIIAIIFVIWSIYNIYKTIEIMKFYRVIVI